MEYFITRKEIAMKTFFYALTLISLVAFIGCGGSQKPATATDEHAAEEHADEHAGHNHAPGETCPAEEDEHAEHSHTKGPQGGQLAILGSHEYHVELVKTAQGGFSAYLYDAQLKPVNPDVSVLNFTYMNNGQPVSVAFTKTADGAAFAPSADTVFPDGWNQDASVMLKINGVPYNQKMAQPQ